MHAMLEVARNAKEGKGTGLLCSSKTSVGHSDYYYFFLINKIDEHELLL